MKKKCLLLVLFSLPLAMLTAAHSHPGAERQDAAAATFPEQILQGTDNFNLAIDLFGDSRGNFGPCG